MRHTLLVLALATTPSMAGGADRVFFRHEQQELEVEGRVEVKAQDGGLLLLGRDGVLWNIEPKNLLRVEPSDKPFNPLDGDQLAAQLRTQLPAGFDVYRMPHFLIFYNTGRGYAQWCGGLFEQLYRAFTSFWTKKGLVLKEPEFPLVAIVFAEKASFTEFARAEAGPIASSILGYYSLRTNRMTMYDLTGLEALGRNRPRRTTLSEITQLLSQPEAERTVATIVHEATHQIAFNCGMNARFSASPLWCTEGIAVFFETPDSSSRGWRTIGGINRARLAQFRQYLRSRPSNSLESLIRNDRRFRDPKESLDAYAEAWGLTWFLVRQRSKEFVEYLKVMAAKPPLIEDDAGQRLAEFEAAFGPLKKLDVEMVRALGKL